MLSEAATRHIVPDMGRHAVVAVTVAHDGGHVTPRDEASLQRMAAVMYALAMLMGGRPPPVCAARRARFPHSPFWRRAVSRARHGCSLTWLILFSARPKNEKADPVFTFAVPHARN